ncbi:hypothetical protein [Providencia stuartii]|uniref:hypothetical protein n=1 Tax=Providencia stuartii TaxID=588 RepID=UPI00111D64B3|nr:hypothetical protein [Providencia rettgeri]QPE15936.1 hypothetical protein IMQ36_12090 [Providencia rettgeri]
MLKQSDMTQDAKLFYEKFPEEGLVTAKRMFWETGFSVAKCQLLMTQFVMAGLLQEASQGFFQKKVQSL